ncbi:MAG: histidine phosphatase family protein [Myxococcota bacterium]
MELLLVRHAEPAWMGPDGGVNDPGLTERGRRQARALAAVVTSRVEANPRGDTQIWVSPAQRSVETAAPVASALGIAPQVRPWLLEAATPDFTGMDPETLGKVWQIARRRDLAEWWQGFPEQEDLRTFTARVAAGLEADLAALGATRAPEASAGLWQRVPRSGRLIIISHAGTTGALIAELLGLPAVPWPWERFPTGHASITPLRTTALAGGVLFALHTLGDVAHLPPEDHTR